MDRHKEIEAFVQVMEHGSLAAAALHAGITPVMMGRRIDALEKRLGTQLIHRSTRRLALTEQGAGFLDECRALLAQWAQAEASVAAGPLSTLGQAIGASSPEVTLFETPLLLDRTLRADR